MLTALESDELSRATIDRKLDEAISNRDLEKAGHGKYKCSNTQHNSQELALDE